MKMILNGQHVDASDGSVVEVTNPATGNVIYTTPKATLKDVDTAIDAAERGKKEWGETPLYIRCQLLDRFADILYEKKEELIHGMCEDTGKALRDCEAEFARLVPLIKGYTGRASHLYGQFYPDSQEGMENDLIMTKRVPLGIVVCLIPFNVPVSMLCQKAIPALVMGNSVIIKAPENNPSAIILAVECMLEAGIPACAVQLLIGKGSEIGDYLCGSPRIDAVTLTGSTHTGMRVAAQCAKNLNSYTFELGGNDAMIIFEDADLEKAAAAAVECRSAVTGQACGASKRFLVQNSVKEEFTRILVEKVKKVRVGNPADPEVEMGCLINERAAVDVEKQVNETIALGAKCLAGGHRNGAFYDLTVLTDVTPDMPVAQDMEIFGPVFPIIGFDTADEAVAINNHTSYGLNACIFGSDLRRNVKVAEQLHVGTVMFDNHNNYRPAEIPWGGPGHSGIGREGVSSSLEEYSELKSYVFRDIR